MEAREMDAVVVYKANPESLQAVLGLLRKEGFNPTTMENPSSADVLSGAGKAAYLISITVPADEEPGARSVLRKWDQERLSEVNKMTVKVAGPFLLSIIVVAVLALVLLLAGILSDAAAFLFVIWIVVFALAANAEKLVRKVRKSP